MSRRSFAGPAACSFFKQAAEKAAAIANDKRAPNTPMMGTAHARTLGSRVRGRLSHNTESAVCPERRPSSPSAAHARQRLSRSGAASTRQKRVLGLQAPFQLPVPIPVASSGPSVGTGQAKWDRPPGSVPTKARARVRKFAGNPGLERTWPVWAFFSSLLETARVGNGV